jgi:hypothetical protein
LIRREVDRLNRSSLAALRWWRLVVPTAFEMPMTGLMAVVQMFLLVPIVLLIAPMIVEAVAVIRAVVVAMRVTIW